MYFVRQRRIALLMETERAISFSYMNPPNCPIKADQSKCSQSDEMFESSKSLSGHIAYDDIGCICPVCWDVIKNGFSQNKYIKSLYLEEANRNLNVEFKMISCILQPQFNSTYLENVILNFETIESDSIKSLKEYLQETQGLKHLEIITGKINKPYFLEQGLAANKSLKFFRFQLDKNCSKSDDKTLQSLLNGLGLNQSLEKAILHFEQSQNKLV